MATELFANGQTPGGLCQTTLNGTITSGVTTLTATSSTGFPAATTATLTTPRS
jgi:hypothetical protein